ncbi:MAG: hypothetical protein IT384_16880 [Deltaproteobacteria bacterium]|nr:hypothetical protein [Deltaproteobacteria bacterium]
MRRRILMVLLALGAVSGFAWGAHSIRHGCHRWHGHPASMAHAPADGAGDRTSRAWP